MGASQLKVSPAHKTIRSYEDITRVVGQDLCVTKSISATKDFYMNVERLTLLSKSLAGVCEGGVRRGESE